MREESKSRIRAAAFDVTSNAAGGRRRRGGDSETCAGFADARASDVCVRCCVRGSFRSVVRSIARACRELWWKWFGEVG